MAEVIVHSDDVIIGRAFRDQLTDIGELTAESGLVTIRGVVEGVETREFRDRSVLLCTAVVKNKTGSVPCRCFLNYHRHKHEEEEIGSMTADNKATVMNKMNRITVGMATIVRGECAYDTDTMELYFLVRDLAGTGNKAL